VHRGYLATIAPATNKATVSTELAATTSQPER
jgi:hypothetical protein